MQHLIEAVHYYRELKEKHDCHLELELRLGYENGGTFCPGVDKDLFFKLESEMKETNLNEVIKTWKEHVDYHYVDTTGRNLRTRVEFNTDDMMIMKNHVQKITEMTFLFKKNCDPSGEAVRLAISREIDINDPPTHCIPTHVRIKQRKEFTDVRDMDTVWSYELSKTWSSSSKSSVEHKQHVCEPVFEVECELVDRTQNYLSKLTDAEIAESILLKAKILIGDEHANLEIKAEQNKLKSKRKKTCRS